MNKEKFEYKVIYKGLKDKKESIIEVESICPHCGNKENIEITTKKVNNEYNQNFYTCKKCETCWQGNVYDKNEETCRGKKNYKGN